MTNELWNKDTERKFFKKYLNIVPPERLFYVSNENRYYAYWPKTYKGKKSTLQSRNAYIGGYTEKWVKEILAPLAKNMDGYALNGVVCEEIGLTKKSPADVAIVRTNEVEQKPENILLLVEVKMSVVWNWEYFPHTKELKCLGDYTTHTGNPSLLRSDSMLKAIGKSINIRVSGKASHIPILILGNTPISESYQKKVDQLKKYGIIQGFYSVNPMPLNEDNADEKNSKKQKDRNLKSTLGEGFLRIDSKDELYSHIKNLLEDNRYFFSSMLPKKELGQLIDLASKEKTHEAMAEKFLKLLEGEK